MTNNERTTEAKKQLRKRIEELLFEFPEDNATQILNKLNNNLAGRTPESVKRTIREIKSNMEHQLEDSTESNVWSVDDEGNYSFKGAEGIGIRVPVTTVDDLFFSYSIHGKNLTQEQVIQRYNLSWPQWERIKSVFKLSKNSNIFSPYTWDNTADQDKTKMVEDKKAEAIQSQWDIISDGVERAKSKELKKIIESDSEERYVINTLISDLAQKTPEPKHIYIKRNKEYDEYRPHAIKVVISDIHLGLEISNDRDKNTITVPFTQTEYNSDIIKARLQEIKQKIFRIGANNVDVYLLGDLIESFTGLNHKNTFHQLEAGCLYNNGIVKFYEIMVDFLQDIPNLRSVKGVPGNHDRFTASKEEDAFGGVAELIFKFLQTAFKDKVQIDISSIYNVDDIEENMMFLLTHGDLGATKPKKETRGRKPKIKHVNATGEKFIRKELKNRMKEYTVVLQGHIHRRETFIDDDDLRWISCPAMVEPNYYANREGYSSTSGYIVIEVEDKDSILPVFRDYPFKTKQNTKNDEE